MKHNEQINSLLKEFSLGNKNIAYKKLLKILDNRKDDLLLRYNIAVIEQQLNFNQKARFNYNFIIQKQNNLKAMVNLYNLDIKEEKYQNALIIINKILEIDKKLDFIIKDKAFVYLKLNRIKEAKNICEQLIFKNKKDFNVLNIYGLCFSAENNFNKAKKIFNEILIYDENNVAALNSLGRLYHENRNSIEAERYLLKALTLDPSSYQILNNIAGFYREEGEYTKGIEYYLKALELNPNNSYILNNLAKSYFDIDDLYLAENYALKALKLNQNDGGIQKILSFIYLKNQDYNKAWSYFDGRLKNSEFVERNESIIKLQSKLFTKKHIKKNKKILILREQGVGDEILYGTMYKDILQDLPNIKIECDKRLLRLFKNSFNSYEDKFVELGTISNNENKLKEFENILYAGSLGRFYRNNINNFPADPYLKVEENRMEQIRFFLNSFDKKVNIGFSWKSFKNRYSNEKSLALEDLINVFSIKNCNFFNLQYGEVSKEILNFRSKTSINLITHKDIDIFNDFDNLAAFLKCLDLFITVSNSTAHLAGALGVKTILIKPSNHALFHYWNQPNNRTPWYKSVKILDKENIMDKNFLNQISEFNN